MNEEQPEKLVDVCRIGREVLKVEGEAVLALIPRLGEEFNEAVEILYRCRGRIIATGMGKTGIIARKFSATLASTGSPSMTLHPVEALHGDLGVVGEDDVVVMISHSGESEEIKNLIPFIKRMGVPLISITGNHNSTQTTRSINNTGGTGMGSGDPEDNLFYRGLLFDNRVVIPFSHQIGDSEQ